MFCPSVACSVSVAKQDSNLDAKYPLAEMVLLYMLRVVKRALKENYVVNIEWHLPQNNSAMLNIRSPFNEEHLACDPH